MKKILLLSALALSGVTASAHADVIDLFYTATNLSGGPGLTSESGSGTITFADGLTTITTPDVTDFSFVLTETDGTNVGTTTFGLSDLLAFAAAVDGSGNVTDLNLTTDFVANTAFYNENLSIAGLADAQTANNSEVGLISTGTAMANLEVPEPASLALLMAGISGISLIRRRRA